MSVSGAGAAPSASSSSSASRASAPKADAPSKSSASSPKGIEASGKAKVAESKSPQTNAVNTAQSIDAARTAATNENAISENAIDRNHRVSTEGAEDVRSHEVQRGEAPNAQDLKDGYQAAGARAVPEAEVKNLADAKNTPAGQVCEVSPDVAARSQDARVNGTAAAGVGASAVAGSVEGTAAGQAGVKPAGEAGANNTGGEAGAKAGAEAGAKAGATAGADGETKVNASTGDVVDGDGNVVAAGADSATAKATEYEVKKGDTLSEIAQREGVSLDAIKQANPELQRGANNFDLIFPGDKVNIPGKTGAGADANGKASADGKAPADANKPGTVDGKTPADANKAGTVDGTTTGNVPAQAQYKPGSKEAIALFQEAARKAGLPESWATSKGLHKILAKESGGWVGRPNYTYKGRSSVNNREAWGSVHNELKNGQKTAKSSATGLGQLLLGNVDKYYPSGRAGIGNPVEEAAGMLNYIKARYGNPDNAWAKYGRYHEGY